MSQEFTDEQKECERMATEGAAALDLVAGIIDRTRKYIIECRPMYMRGNMPSVVSFDRDKHMLSALCQQTTMNIFFESQIWIREAAKESEELAAAAELFAQKMSKKDVLIVSFGHTMGRLMFTRTAHFDKGTRGKGIALQ